LERLLIDSNQDDGVRSKTVLSGSLDIADDVLAGHEVDKVVCSKFLGHFSLLFTSIDSNDIETHSLGVLAGQ
jgi:hypothetical protein